MERLDLGILAAVAIGSAAGGVARHLLTELVVRLTGPGLPWGTLFVNVSGSLCIGLLTALAGTTLAGWPAIWRHATITGVLGGFTTFSAFSVQTMVLLQQGQWLAAVFNVCLSVGLGIAACWVGFAVVASAGR